MKSLYQMLVTGIPGLVKIRMNEGKVFIVTVKDIVLVECEPDEKYMLDQLSEEILVKFVQTTRVKDMDMYIVVG